MTASDPIKLRLSEIQRAFDTSFAEPAASHEEARRSVLAIRAGEGRFGVRVEHLAGVEACGKIVKLSESLPGLLGVVGLRGRLFAAYDLGALLGQPGHEPGERLGPPSVAAPLSGRTGPGDRSSWLLVCRGEARIGLLIDELEALLRVADASIMPVDPGSSSEHVREVLRQGSTLRGVIDISSLTSALSRRAEESLGGRRRG